jgi:hypothetical protein
MPEHDVLMAASTSSGFQYFLTVSSHCRLASVEEAD